MATAGGPLEAPLRWRRGRSHRPAISWLCLRCQCAGPAGFTVQRNGRLTAEAGEMVQAAALMFSGAAGFSGQFTRAMVPSQLGMGMSPSWSGLGTTFAAANARTAAKRTSTTTCTVQMWARRTENQIAVVSVGFRAVLTPGPTRGDAGRASQFLTLHLHCDSHRAVRPSLLSHRFAPRGAHPGLACVGPETCPGPFDASKTEAEWGVTTRSG